MKTFSLVLAQAALLLVGSTDAFSVGIPASVRQFSTITTTTPAEGGHGSSSLVATSQQARTGSTRLYMSDRQSSKSTKKKVITIQKDKVEEDEEDIPEEQYRVVLHNDEVHTFQYVVRALVKVIGTLDRKAAFEVCVTTHGVGKATVTKTWKKQAQQFCMGLQRQGLTASISPDKDFEGGHVGGGNG